MALKLEALGGAAGIAFGTTAIVVVVAIGLVSLTSQSTSSTLSGSSTACVIQGQPGGIAVRVLSDSNMEPLAGVLVVAKNTPATCNGEPATARTSVLFTTNGTEWVTLPSDNNYQYHFNVTYAGQSYTFAATLMPVSLTCATIFLPSGRTNVTTTEFGVSCLAIQG